jgi:hypothetical protein
MDHPLNHLKRARPTGLAPFIKHNNITNTQNQVLHFLEKIHATGHKNNNNNKTTNIQITNTQNNHKHNVNKQKHLKYQISHRNYVIKAHILDIAQDNCLYKITHKVSTTKSYLSNLHTSHKYITQNTYLLNPHRKTPTIFYYLGNHSSTISPPTSLYVWYYTNKNNYFVLNKHSTLYIISTTLTKNKQTQILIKTTHITKSHPTIYPYIATYNKLTNPPPTQHQNTKTNTKLIHMPTHPQTNLPPPQINPYKHIKTKTKPITLSNKRYNTYTQQNIRKSTQNNLHT